MARPRSEGSKDLQELILFSGRVTTSREKKATESLGLVSGLWAKGGGRETRGDTQLVPIVSARFVEK